MNTYKRYRFPPDIISYTVPKALREAGSLALLLLQSETPGYRGSTR
ncbi:hypothetical protein [Congregibacter sp.]